MPLMAAMEFWLTQERFAILRDVLLFFAGLGGVVHETVMSETERPALLFLFAVMMGLTAYVRTDEARKKILGDDKGEGAAEGSRG